jgi:hypothetical protein
MTTNATLSNQPQTQTKTYSRPYRPSLPWACSAWLHGRLSRTKPDEAGKRILLFNCTDGTKFAIAGIGNDVHDGGGSPVLHLLTYADRAFNTDGYWLTYPADRRGTPALTLALRSDMPRGEVDTLRFGASVKAIEDGTLTLFVGRRGRPGYHFLSLTIPSGLVLPELGYQCWVTGTATRNGSQWDLATIEAKPKAKNQRSPRPHRPTKVS